MSRAAFTHAAESASAARSSVANSFSASALHINRPGDSYEQEADRAADQVVSSSPVSASARKTPWSLSKVSLQARLQRECACGGECEDCKKETMLKREATGAPSHAVAPPIVHSVLSGAGRQLDPSTRCFMESRFGHDFSSVRIFNDGAAAESALAVSANAYTVGEKIVFNESRYSPSSESGRRLLAHELAHVVQQSHGPISLQQQVFRQTEEDEERKRREAARAGQQPDAGSPAAAKVVDDAGMAATTTQSGDKVAAPGVDQPKPAVDVTPAGDPAKAGAGAPPQTPSVVGDTTAATAQAAPSTAQSAVTPGGHAAAQKGAAPCPDAPGRALVVVGCTSTPAASPPAAEKAELPKVNTTRFGGDQDRAKFAKELAGCHAARAVNEEIEKRYRQGVAAAKSQATEAVKQETDATMKTAVEGIDPKDKAALARAKVKAAAEAKKAGAKKIADAQAAVARQDVAPVTAELAAKFEDDLAKDYDETIKAAFNRYGPGWLRSMQSVLESKRKRITSERNAKPKVAKGEEPPPPKSADQIASEIEAAMTEVRCDQQEWARQQIEDVAHGWAVGRREQVDFETISQKAAFLSKFNPTYNPAEGDRVPIPADVIQTGSGTTGVAPEMSDFLSQLKADPGTPPFKASTYVGHGGGSWAGKGFSVDLFITAATDQRGFWQHNTAVAFLLRLDATAKLMGARWRVLYNDFRVAQEVNEATGARNVEFTGGTDKAGGLNWHGPAPLILHFHLDLEIPQKPTAPAGGAP